MHACRHTNKWKTQPQASRVSLKTNPQTHKQSNKRANENLSYKSTSEQTSNDKQSNKTTNEATHKHNKETSKQTCNQANKQTNAPTNNHTYKYTNNTTSHQAAQKEHQLYDIQNMCKVKTPANNECQHWSCKLGAQLGRETWAMSPRNLAVQWAQRQWDERVEPENEPEWVWWPNGALR